MADYCRVTDFFNLLQSTPAIDVRSPSEYAEGHIPACNSLPIMDDEQRARIGTVYKQKGKFEAIHLGFELVGPKLGQIISFAKDLAVDNKLLIYCWRGGMRSKNMAWLLESNGIECTILEGGYKAFRQYGKQLFEQDYRSYIVGGFTGSNKTKVLYALKALGEQVLDIEAIARHRGSSFGKIGQEAQRTNQQFENKLMREWMKFDPSKRIWIEDESKILGANHIPEPLYLRIRNSHVLKLEVERSQRAINLVEDYGLLDKTELEKAIRRIERKLGGLEMKEALDALENDNFNKVAEISLAYYDKTYDFGLSKRAPSSISSIIPASNDPEATANQLIEFVEKSKK